MDRDRVKGKAKVVIGGIKAKAGKMTGNADLKEEGEAERGEGKVQGAVARSRMRHVTSETASRMP